MLTSNTRSWLEIHVSRIEHNVAEIQKLLLGTNKIMGIVKANAYGHGDVVCAKELERIGIDFSVYPVLMKRCPYVRVEFPLRF